MKRKNKIFIMTVAIFFFIFCIIMLYAKVGRQKNRLDNQENIEYQKTEKEKKDSVEESLTEDQLPFDTIEQQNDDLSESNNSSESKSENNTSSQTKKKETQTVKVDNQLKDNQVQEKGKEEEQLEIIKEDQVNDSNITIVKPDSKEKKDSIELPIDEFQ